MALLRDAAQAWVDDRAASLGAGLASYTLFSLAPLLLIVVSVAGLAFGPAAARGEVVSEVAPLIGTDSARSLEQALQSVSQPAASRWGALVGTATLLLGATSVFGALQSTLDRLWRVPESPRRGPWLLLRGWLRSLALVLAIGLLLLASLLANTALTALEAWWAPRFGPLALLAGVANGALGFALATLLFALTYKLIPSAHIAWREVWLGASITGLLLTTGKGLLGLYFAGGAVASPFGAAASLVVVLLWLYYSAQIFLFGAEITWLVAKARGLHNAPARQRG